MHMSHEHDATHVACNPGSSSAVCVARLLLLRAYAYFCGVLPKQQSFAYLGTNPSVSSHGHFSSIRRLSIAVNWTVKCQGVPAAVSTPACVRAIRTGLCSS